jgi:1,4-dihydroxy-2-naphthoyl-CoA hydrolase
MNKKIWKDFITLEVINAMGKNTLGEHLGMEFLEIGDDYLLASMPVDARTLQPAGLLHGGASVALAETLGSVAGVAMLEDPLKESVVGVEINANHLRPVTKGKVFGKVSPVKMGKNIQVWNIEIKDEKDRLVCVSRLTTMKVKRG